jgi:hypothetical protein
MRPTKAFNTCRHPNRSRGKGRGRESTHHGSNAWARRLLQEWEVRARIGKSGMSHAGVIATCVHGAKEWGIGRGSVGRVYAGDRARRGGGGGCLHWYRWQEVLLLRWQQLLSWRCCCSRLQWINAQTARSSLQLLHCTCCLYYCCSTAAVVLQVTCGTAMRRAGKRTTPSDVKTVMICSQRRQGGQAAPQKPCC